MTRKQIEAAIKVNEESAEAFCQQVLQIEQDVDVDGDERVVLLSIAGTSASFCACRVEELKAMLEVTE
jgi:hypothetical protein